MIRKGIHHSAVIDVMGQSVIPSTTIMEPLSSFFVGKNGQLYLGEMNTFYPHCSIRIDEGWMRTGVEVSFGSGVAIYEPRAGLDIGNHCLIGGGTIICGASHGFVDFDVPIRHQKVSAKKIVLENNVWIGMRCVILPGVRIGSGTVIGAGSVVTHDIPSGCVAFGSPCVVQRQRTVS